MLHVLVIALFGDTSGGGTRRGEKLWGALTVTVQGLSERGISLALDRGAALLPQPGTAISPQATPEAIKQIREGRALVAADGAPVDALSSPALAPSYEVPSLISKEIDKPVTDFVVPKPSVDRAYVPPTPESPPPQLPREAPVVAPPVIAQPVIEIPKPTSAVPPKVERSTVVPLPVIRPVEPLLREEPVAVPPVAPNAEPPTPLVEREVAKPVILMPEQRPNEIIPAVVPPVASPPIVPAPAPVANAPKPERETMPAVAPPADPKPREAPVAVPAASRGETARAQPEIQTQAAPASTTKAAPPLAPSRSQTGVPSGTTDLFKPRGDSATPSADEQVLGPAPGKTPGIDLDAVRKRAREIDRSGDRRAAFPFPVVPPQKPKTKEQQAFDKALKKNDCRDAYADIGLAAVVPLLIDAVRDGGCKW